jgi:DNA-binding NarL/FixJ family response regulator
MSERPVTIYVASLLSKMRMARRTEAAVYAVRHESRRS